MGLYIGAAKREVLVRGKEEEGERRKNITDIKGEGGGGGGLIGRH